MQASSEPPGPKKPVEHCTHRGSLPAAAALPPQPGEQMLHWLRSLAVGYSVVDPVGQGVQGAPAPADHVPMGQGTAYASPSLSLTQPGSVMHWLGSLDATSAVVRPSPQDTHSMLLYPVLYQPLGQAEATLSVQPYPGLATQASGLENMSWALANAGSNWSSVTVFFAQDCIRAGKATQEVAGGGSRRSISSKKVVSPDTPALPRGTG